jgi:transcriptional regulator with XRE-family HTH domain
MPMPKSERNPIDAHVGSRVFLMRNILGITRELLSEELGVSVQRLEKYEDGSRRIGATMLLKIAAYLRTPPSFFFGDFPQSSSTESADFQGQGQYFPGGLLPAEGLELIRIMLRIKDAATRKKILDYAASISDPEAPWEKNETPN